MKKKKGKTLEKKLKAYSAAVAGTLLLAPAAHAAVQYSGPQNLAVNAGTTPVFIDLNSDTVNDFVFWLYYGTFSLGMVETTSAGLGGNGHIDDGYYDPANLPGGYPIRNTLSAPYTWTSAVFFDTLAGVPPWYGNFYVPGTRGYIGVRFRSPQCPLGGPPHYGWIQFEHDASQPPFTQGTIIDWAYEDTCNTPILAGAGAAPAVPVPTLNQWGILILIALLAGTGTWMLRKKEEAS